MATITFIDDLAPPKVTTSKTLTIQGSHIFRIEDYSYKKGLGIGKHIGSDAFSIAGHLWKIQFYPDGSKEHDSGDIYVSVYIKLAEERVKDLWAWCEYYLLDQNGNRWQRIDGSNFQKMGENRRCIDGPYNFRGGFSGHNDFYKRSDLEASQFIIGDCLTIQCSVSVLKTSKSMDYVHVPKTLAQPLPLSDGSELKQSFEQLLETGEESDVSFEVEGEIFNAHKLILSTRSPVFKAQFFGPLKDDSTQNIKIKEMQAPIFKALLHFIYCDAIPDLNSDSVSTIMTQHLLAAADRYGIQRLKSLCESRLCQNIDIGTVVSTIGLAEQYGCFELKSSCLEFIGLRENLEAVMQTDGFKNLNESCPSFMGELLQSVVFGRDTKRAKLRK